jgi:hypothetical protein
MPTETRNLFPRYAVEIVPIGPSRADRGRYLMDRLADKPIFFQRFSSHSHAALFVNAFASIHLADEAPGLAADLATFAPNLLICDAFNYRPLYRRMAASLGAALAFQRSGAIAQDRRPFVKAYGLTDRSEVHKRGLELLGALASLAFKILVRLRYIRIYLAGRRAKAAAERVFALGFPVVGDRAAPEIEIATGLADIERQITHRDIPPASSGRLELGPTPVVYLDPPPDDDLARWLGRFATPSVIYVSFGSIVGLTARFVRTVYKALADLGHPTLWSLPRAKWPLVENLKPAPGIRIEDYVDQADVLRNPAIRLFINHGGANSVQESLAGGKPMILIPFVFDQPLNSSTMEHLGVARRILPRDVTERRLRDEILAALKDDQMTARALTLREDYWRSESSDRLADVLLAHVNGAARV